MPVRWFLSLMLVQGVRNNLNIPLLSTRIPPNKKQL
nr:MAG TPA: hypothetical protein [Bacteriophage sp.]